VALACELQNVVSDITTVVFWRSYSGGMRHRVIGRRRFLWDSVALAGLGMLAACGLPLPGAQRPALVKRLGFLGPTVHQPYYDGLEEGLHDLGYAKGQHYTIEYRYAEGKLERLPELAAELARLNVDLIVIAGNITAQAAKDATSQIPIVMGISTDPLEGGLIASLAQPGGNVTGLSLLSTPLTSKRVGLLKEALPAISRLAVLMNPLFPTTVAQRREAERVAQAGGLQLYPLEVRGVSDFAGAFEAASRERVEALLVLDDAVFTAQRAALVELAAQHRLPAMYASGDIARAGGLLAYAPNFADQFRRAAVYVDKILNGAKPADLPVEQPSKFDFLVNQKTAQALGLVFPPSVLQQATEVIQ